MNSARGLRLESGKEVEEEKARNCPYILATALNAFFTQFLFRCL